MSALRGLGMRVPTRGIDKPIFFIAPASNGLALLMLLRSPGVTRMEATLKGAA